MELWDDFEDNTTSCLAVLIATILVIAIAFGLACFEGWLLMLVWNAVMPLIWATAPVLEFWWAVGIVFICNLLFGGGLIKIKVGK